MNNEGWGLGTMLGLLAILLLGLFYSLPLINKNFGLQDITQIGVNDYYQKQEDNLVAAANKYTSVYLTDVDNATVTIKTLKAFNYIEPIYSYNKDSECSGYIKIIKNGNSYNYEPYLKCPQYTTNNYNAQLDVK
jgi:hypothetical protein